MRLEPNFLRYLLRPQVAGEQPPLAFLTFQGDRRRLALANPVSIANDLGQVLRRAGQGGDLTVRREGMSPLQLSPDLFGNQSLLDALPSLQAFNLPEVE